MLKSVLLLYFAGNGEGGIFAAEADLQNLEFKAVASPNRALVTPKVGPDRLMRDPSAVRGPDGTFHVVWTSGWWDRSIGYASTRDFVTWSEQRALPVMEHRSGALNAWAPEVVYDEQREEFVIYWSTTIRTRFLSTSHPAGDKAPDGAPLNHRFYYTTTKDFASFSPTRLLWDPGFNCIDATMIERENGWLMVGKDETKAPQAAKFLFTAQAKHPTGPWTMLNRRITGDYWAEGPIVYEHQGSLTVLLDRYTEGRWGAVSEHGGGWREAPQPRMPEGARHGSLIEVGGLLPKLRARLNSSR